MISLTSAMDSLVEYNTFYLATLWKITRADSTVLRFTDHDKQIEFGGDTYDPAGGFDASARQKQSSLRTQNFEIQGMLQSGRITFEDLQAGRYNEAEVTEYLVDWRYPFAGSYLTSRYWIVETTFTADEWEARVEGLTRWLNHPDGELYERTCRYELGEARCGVALGPITTSGSVFVTSFPGQDDRRQFLSTIAAADGLYAYGFIEWTSGNNNGLVSEVENNLQFTGQMNLFLETPYPIESGDTFDITQGCDKKKGTCGTKFSNFANFGGFPFIPGTTEALKTP